MRRAFNIALDAYWHFLADDGWAIASHIALSALMAMFPFFILLTSLAGIFGSSELPDEVAKLMLATWPEEDALPIAREIHDVLTTTHTRAVTIGALFAIFFASSGVESLRIGLNRAYGMVETRHWILLRLESIAYVLVAAVGLLALGFLIVPGALIFRTALRHGWSRSKAPSRSSASRSRPWFSRWHCLSRINGCQRAGAVWWTSCPVLS